MLESVPAKSVSIGGLCVHDEKLHYRMKCETKGKVQLFRPGDAEQVEIDDTTKVRKVKARIEVCLGEHS